ncbi:MAG: ABC transporter substrate-binding protein [Janthinobacterium lividum]
MAPWIIRVAWAMTILIWPTIVHAQAGQSIDWWYGRGANPGQQRALDDALVAPFNTVHPGRKLDIEFRGSIVDRQIRIALLSGVGPDIVMAPGPSYLVPMEAAGYLLPLDDYARKYGWDRTVIPQILKIGTYGGHLYAVPRTDETMGLFFDRALFARNGWSAPKTLDELEALATSMMAKGIIPFGAGNADWRGANEWYITLVLNHFAGPDKVRAALQGTLAWTDPVFVQAITLLQRWYRKGWFGKTYFTLTNEQGFAQIADGNAGMSPNGFWAFQWVTAHFAARSADLGVEPFPTLRSGVPYPVFAVGVGSTLSINSRAKDPDAAASVIDAMLNPAFYQRINKGWPGDWNLPINGVDDAALATNTSPQYAKIVTGLTRALADGHYGYATWAFWPPATEQYLINGIEQVWLGQMTPEAYLQQVDKTFQIELKQGRVPPVPGG